MVGRQVLLGLVRVEICRDHTLRRTHGCGIVRTAAFRLAVCIYVGSGYIGWGFTFSPTCIRPFKVTFMGASSVCTSND